MGDLVIVDDLAPCECILSCGAMYLEAGNEYEYDFGYEKFRAHVFQNQSAAKKWLRNLIRDYPGYGWHIETALTDKDK